MNTIPKCLALLRTVRYIHFRASFGGELAVEDQYVSLSFALFLTSLEVKNGLCVHFFIQINRVLKQP